MYRAFLYSLLMRRITALAIMQWLRFVIITSQKTRTRMSLELRLVLVTGLKLSGRYATGQEQ